MAYTGVNRHMLVRILTAVVIIGLLCFWVILLAGTGAAHKQCSDIQNGTGGGGGSFNLNNLNQLINGRRLMSSGRELLQLLGGDCNTSFSFFWWIVFFQLFCIVIVISLSFSDWMTAHAQPPLVVLMTMVTTLLMYFAAQTNSAIDVTAGDMKSGLQAAMAGAVGCIILNCVYLITATEASGTMVLGFRAGGTTFQFGNQVAAGSPAKTAPTSPAVPELAHEMVKQPPV